MHSYWASILILLQEVLDQINSICQNFLWGGAADYMKSPLIAWGATCKPKTSGGLGLKNLTAWNKTRVVNLLWDMADKKDNLWVKWIHGRYLHGSDFWSYQTPPDCSWYWRKLIILRDLFKREGQPGGLWDGWMKYKTSTGYKWLIGDIDTPWWRRVIWVTTITPCHATTFWVFIQHRLPVKQWLSKYMIMEGGNTCELCQEHEEENINHLFFRCEWATAYWHHISSWWVTSISFHD